MERIALPALPLLVVAVSAALMIQAGRADAAHRAAAERTLRDYAAFAAWQYASHARMAVRHATHVALQPLHAVADDPGVPLPDPARLLVAARDPAACDCALALAARFAFRVDLADGSLVVQRPDGAVVGDGAVARDVRSVLGSLRRRTPLPRFADGGGHTERLLLARVGGEDHAILYTGVPDRSGHPRALYGLVASAAPLTDVLRRIATRGALLPRALVGAVPNDRVLHVRVTRADGTPVFEGAPPVRRGFAASDTVGGAADALTATVTIRPDAAARLLIGGLPPSRTGVHVALFALSVVLVGAAFAQFRRWQALARTRGLFVASVSHELRTPLAQILMFSEMLLGERERPAAEVRHFAVIMRREARRLATLVESVLEFSRTQAGTRTLRPELVLITEEVHEAVRTFEPVARAAGAHVVPSCDDDLLEAVVDPEAFRQIVLNLLDNAVRYGPRAQTVTVRLERGPSALRLAVADQGPGIPPGSRREVLRPFVRLDPPDGRRVAGTGIGLSVVHALAVAHGGAVEVGDAPGGGALVSVIFPQQVRDEPSGMSAAACIPGAGRPPTAGPAPGRR